MGLAFVQCNLSFPWNLLSKLCNYQKSSKGFESRIMLKFLHTCFLGLILIHFLHTSYAQQDPNCKPSSCGNINNITYPFRLGGDPLNCGNPSYELSCENNITFLYLYSQRYIVRAINYNNYTIRLADASITNDTCSLPRYSLFDQLYTDQDYPYSTRLYTHARFVQNAPIAQPATILTCPNPVNYSFYIRTDHCVENDVSVNASNRRYTYIRAGNLNASDVGERCRIELVVLISMEFQDYDNVTLQEFHDSLVYGLELSWFSGVCDVRCGALEYCGWIGNRAVCVRTRGECFIYTYSFECVGLVRVLGQAAYVLVDAGPRLAIAAAIALRVVIGMPIIFGLLIYKFRRRHLSMFDVIEGFLQTQNNLAPIRYAHSDIKKMTKGFREKLGQGGYGSVYKGKLRSGQDVAVKVLSSKTKANGQDFINEVSTIGRIHHVNVVKLVGFSSERSKRALVYDFMPNGSLEKYIFGTNSLNWRKKYEISLGVARGIEYLHCGCDIQILHFDIKPHNILLDEDFTPKISDFGLAKFYSTDNNTVTLTAARGTIGYVAPELINRSIGNISYKADVYSFGMLLMEIVGLKRDLVGNRDDSSLYFPYWIYNHLDKWKDMEIGNVNEIVTDNDDDEKITRKMAIVALWCIQMSPGDRPSMSKVVEMLEGEVGSLQVPPHPCFSAQNVVQSEDQTWGTDSTTGSSIDLLSSGNFREH